jgi:hypothetical protein
MVANNVLKKSTKANTYYIYKYVQFKCNTNRVRANNKNNKITFKIKTTELKGKILFCN